MQDVPLLFLVEADELEILEFASLEFVEFQSVLEYLADSGLAVREFLGLLDPLLDDFFVGGLLHLQSFVGLEFLVSDHIKDD